MTTNWEYCALVSHAAEADGKPGEWLCRVSWFTPGGVVTEQLRDAAAAFPTDAFERAMAQLGAGGWELVSLHHELVSLNTQVGGERYLASVHTGYAFSPFGVAYFKRPIQEGRAISEPGIQLAGT
jgi:hypothetical protein